MKLLRFNNCYDILSFINNRNLKVGFTFANEAFKINDERVTKVVSFAAEKWYDITSGKVL